MTNQELFDKVVKHLLTQGEKSTSLFSDEDTGILGERCQYRGEKGRKCAIGCLIPDEEYNPLLEGKSVLTEVVMDAAGLDGLQADFARILQSIHDSDLPADWEWRLKRFARSWDLEWNYGPENADN